MAVIKLALREKLEKFNKANPERAMRWEDIAEKVGTSYQTFNNYTKSPPKQIQYLHAFAKAVECSVDELIVETKE